MSVELLDFFEIPPHYMSKVNTTGIKDLYYETLCHGIIWNDQMNPLLASNLIHFKDKVTKIKRRMMTTPKLHSIVINKKHFEDDSNGSKSKRYNAIAAFELKMASLRNFICHGCNTIHIDYQNNRKIYKCKLCQKDKKNDKNTNSHHGLTETFSWKMKFLYNYNILI